ncbi:hypothetical protein DLH72_03950 [Candidatus Gracilibacteria bacterium]|nr:MAG: hypothetical protein DLH72_03950 [Candidatus Gracilibacteria bacterium]
MENKKAFSFVELIIVLSILIMIAIVITKISGDTKDKADNSKIKSDIIALNSAVLSTFEQEKNIPLPDGNLNYYNSKGGYSHENFDDPTNPAFGVYGRITEKTIGRQFLSEVPRDPRTNWYYSYGILREGNFFDVAGVVKQKDDYKAKVMGSYAGDRGISDLIREYNGPYFVSDNGPNLPYNPEKVILTASDSSGNSFSEGDVLEYKDNKFSKNGVQINAQLTIEKNGKKYYELYFSDGNIGRLDFNNGEDYVKLTFGKDNHEFKFDDGGIKSKVSLFLEAGSLWVFASDTKKSESEFSIITQDITAAVRGTIFKVEKNNNLATKVIVVKGVVEITKGNQDAIISNLNSGLSFQKVSFT